MAVDHRLIRVPDMQTLLLDTVAWDLAVDTAGNIAVASDPYSQAQDAASAIRTFEGEVYFDTTLGIPYFQQILGYSPPLSLMKAYFNSSALTVPGVTKAQSFITSWENRSVAGQVQIMNENSQVSAAGF
jgi:hypothetical protein